MVCPQCESTAKHGVLETRSSLDGRIMRRRKCGACGHAFRTVEQLSESGMQVRKVDGRVVPFVRDSIHTSIRKAAAGRLETHQLDELVDMLVTDAYRLSDDGPIPTSRIADCVLTRLRTVDPATHIRFALVHAGRQDRTDARRGWQSVDEVRAWLAQEYPELIDYRPATRLSHVVKRDGRLVPFDRTKLERGIGIASKGRGDQHDVRKLATEVADDVMAALGNQPVATSGQIAAEILRSLRQRDDVAYLRFASTVKRFSSAEQYQAEAVALARTAADASARQ